MTFLKRISPYLLILVPVATFYGFFFRYTVNAPVNDDYPAVLQFLNSYVTAGSLHEKLTLIFSQHNEHRIVYDRIWTLISYKLNKNVNFNFLSLIGNLSLLGIAAIFFWKFRKMNKTAFLFIPVTILLFNLCSWENVIYSMTSLSNFTVHFFMLLSLVFLASSTRENTGKVLIAVLFFFAAMMTQGGALMLVPVSILILLYKRAYKNLLIYAIFSALILMLYFHNYFQPPTGAGLMPTLLKFKVRSLLFVFAFLGNAFNYFLIYTNDAQESTGITIIIGFLLFVLFLYITKTKYYTKNLFNYSVMLLIVMISVVTALSRASMGLDMAGASRYRINGILLLISLYFWYIETYKAESKRSLAVIMAFSTWYFLMININHYEYLAIMEERGYEDILSYNSGENSMWNDDKAMTDNQRSTIEQSKKLNVYHPPSTESLVSYFPWSVKQAGMDTTGNSTLEMVKSVHGIHKVAGDYLIDGFAFLTWISANKEKVYVGIKNELDKNPVFFTSNQISRFDLNPFFNKFNLKNGGFRARIKGEDIMAGENTVWIMVKVKDQIKIIETDSKITK